MKQVQNIDMELTVEGLGETLKLIGTSLFIGNEYDSNKTSVFLEDVSQVKNKEIIERLMELNKVVSETVTEVKQLAIEAYETEWMVEGALDDAEKVA